MDVMSSSHSPALDDDHKRIFHSIFPTKSYSTATPVATPNIGVIPSPGAIAAQSSASQTFNTDDSLRYVRAWSTATRFLTISPGLGNKTRDLSNEPDAESALHFLTSHASTNKELLDWYLHEIDIHCRYDVLPKLDFWNHPLPASKVNAAFSETVAVLQRAQNLYFAIGELRRDFTSTRSRLYSFIDQLKEYYHARLLQILPSQRIERSLAFFLFQSMEASLKDSDGSDCYNTDYCHCPVGIDVASLEQLREVGLGGPLSERAFALAVRRFLQGPAIERRCFRVDWAGRTSVMSKLRSWVMDRFMPAAQSAVAALTGDQNVHLPPEQFLAAAVNSFGQTLRVGSLFDHVRNWPASTGAVLDVREYIVNTGLTMTKALMCASFSEQIQRRLLHAGASTTEILNVYLSVIHVFQLLDSRGVLLEKVAIPIRNYLREREDTVAIIAASLLADIDENGVVSAHDEDKICAEIATEVAKSAVDADTDRSSDFNDMEWVPDPIDAGPNYKSSKADDVVAHILGLFEKEDFMTAFTSAFGESLLRSTSKSLFKETKIIELLKSRLDAAQMQEAEVMLKDMSNSATLVRRFGQNVAKDEEGAIRKPPATPKQIQAAIPDEGITITSLFEMFKDCMDRKQFAASLHLVANRRDDLYFPKRTRLPREPKVPEATSQARNETEETMHVEVKVISAHFWPELRVEEFRLPLQAQGRLEEFADQYRNSGGQRRLAYKPSQCKANITLELEDRTVELGLVDASIASVLATFAREDNDGAHDNVPYDPEVGLSIAEVAQNRRMSIEIATSAINHLHNRRILYEISPGHYAVLEHLDMETESQWSNGDDQAGLEAAVSAVKTDAEKLREQAPTFTTFILTMLRANGARPVDGMMGITSMVKMVLPSFTWGDEEIVWLLEEMEKEGSVVRDGAVWKVAV